MTRGQKGILVKKRGMRPRCCIDPAPCPISPSPLGPTPLSSFPLPSPPPPQLEYVDVGGTDMPSAAAPALSSLLHTLPRLRKYFLGYNALGADGADVIASVLNDEGVPEGLHLWVNNNDIGDVGARSLADALSRNTTLAMLGVAQNSITASGARALGDALAANTTLKEVRPRPPHESLCWL